MTVRTLFADGRLVVLDKPSGLLSVPGRGPEHADCLPRRIARRHPGARTVHRLDRDTSGVIVMGLDADAHRELSRQFQDREVDKSYIAIVAGRVLADRGDIDLPMRADIDNRPRQIIDHQQGKHAVTRFKVLERLDDRTRLELTPLTGRSHQLRVHLQAIGHPILGDDLYAPPFERDLVSRLLLHARSLRLTHPGSGRRLAFFSPCPF